MVTKSIFSGNMNSEKSKNGHFINVQKSKIQKNFPLKISNKKYNKLEK